LGISLGAAAAVGMGYFPLGGVLLLLSGIFDVLDGALARAKNQITRLGALLDSTLDRLAEAAVFFGLLVFYVREGSAGEVLLVNVALVASVMVSYIRARGEGLGLEGTVGIFTREVRILVLALGLLLNQAPIALGVIGLFGFVTAGQRFLYFWQQIRRQRD
jgi:CDP-diacylglycerol--glycerol-3-phosphate 3-phosphatidyltransferase